MPLTPPTLSPAAEQDFFDLLFELDGLTAETLGEAFLTVREEQEGEALRIPLQGLPAEPPAGEDAA